MKIPIFKLIWLNEKLRPTPEEVAKEYVENQTTPAELGGKYDLPVGLVIDCLDYYGIARKQFFGVGKRITCEDGHLVRSSLEKQVDNFLFEKGMKHEYEPKLPWGRCMADFKVGSHYIEIWGLAPNNKNVKNKIISRYIVKMDEKREKYSRCGLSLIELYPEDIPHNLAEKLEILNSHTVL